jgi:hypothetical protein
MRAHPLRGVLACLAVAGVVFTGIAIATSEDAAPPMQWPVGVDDKFTGEGDDYVVATLDPVGGEASAGGDALDYSSPG